MPENKVTLKNAFILNLNLDHPLKEFNRVYEVPNLHYGHTGNYGPSLLTLKGLCPAVRRS